MTNTNTETADRVMKNLVDFAKNYAAENCGFVSVHYSQGKLFFVSTIVKDWTRQTATTELKNIKKAVVEFYNANPDLFEGRKVSHSRNNGHRIWSTYCARQFDGWASGVELKLTEEETTAILLGCWC